MFEQPGQRAEPVVSDGTVVSEQVWYFDVAIEVQFVIVGRHRIQARSAAGHFVWIHRINEFWCDGNQQFDVVSLLTNSAEHRSDVGQFAEEWCCSGNRFGAALQQTRDRESLSGLQARRRFRRIVG